MQEGSRGVLWGRLCGWMCGEGGLGGNEGGNKGGGTSKGPTGKPWTCRWSARGGVLGCLLGGPQGSCGSERGPQGEKVGNPPWRGFRGGWGEPRRVGEGTGDLQIQLHISACGVGAGQNPPRQLMGIMTPICPTPADSGEVCQDPPHPPPPVLRSPRCVPPSPAVGPGVRLALEGAPGPNHALAGLDAGQHRRRTGM